MDIDPLVLAQSIPLGTTAEVDLLVTDDKLAPGRGVFGTPQMVGLMESAASRALAPLLAEGWTSVGTEVCIRHLAATLPGNVVRARATVVSNEGRRLRLAVEAFNPQRKIGEGTHERALVHLQRFQEAAARPRSGGPGN